MKRLVANEALSLPLSSVVVTEKTPLTGLFHMIFAIFVSCLGSLGPFDQTWTLGLVLYVTYFILSDISNQHVVDGRVSVMTRVTIIKNRQFLIVHSISFIRDGVNICQGLSLIFSSIFPSPVPYSSLIFQVNLDRRHTQKWNRLPSSPSNVL